MAVTKLQTTNNHVMITVSDKSTPSYHDSAADYYENICVVFLSFSSFINYNLSSCIQDNMRNINTE